jgi:hypothetical protein
VTGTTQIPVPAVTPATGGDRAPARAWRVVAALAVSQAVEYGVLSYAFAVLLVPMQHDVHTGRATITGALRGRRHHSRLRPRCLHPDV